MRGALTHNASLLTSPKDASPSLSRRSDAHRRASAPRVLPPCRKLQDSEVSSLAWTLGSSAALMIILGYPGELIIEGDLGTRWVYWTLAMLPFLYIVYTLLVGLQGAVAKESDPNVKQLLNYACLATVVSWCTYPVVYVLPMMGFSGADAVIGIQLGYCVSDIISKCGVGFLIYNITIAKSAATPLVA